MKLRHLLIAATALSLATVATAQEQPAISADNLSADTRVLASDEFLGRAPGTVGEQRTVDWLVGRLQSLDLEPAGPDGSWTQAVPLVRTLLGAAR